MKTKFDIDKFKAFYIIIIILELLMIITGGFNFGLVGTTSISKLIYGLALPIEIVEMWYAYFLSIPNLLIFVLILISSIVVTKRKENTIKNKKLYLAIIIILAICIPVFKVYYIKTESYENIYIWDESYHKVLRECFGI